MGHRGKDEVVGRILLNEVEVGKRVWRITNGTKPMCSLDVGCSAGVNREVSAKEVKQLRCVESEGAQWSGRGGCL